VEAETGRIVLEMQKKLKLPGFRPGKVPATVIRTKFPEAVRKEVLDSIVPRIFNERARREDLKVVGQPNVTELHFHEGGDLHFKAEFEVAPEFDLGEYTDLTTPYEEQPVTDEDMAARLDYIREQKAEYVNIDPRPLAEGDYAAIALRSIAGLRGKPMESDDMVLRLGAEETLPDFTAGLLGASPGDEKDIDVTYPEDYSHDRLAGQTVRFQVKVKAVRRKEVPEICDEFAQDVGDFKTIEELRAEIRRTMLREKELEAQARAKTHLVDTLIDSHEFPVPDTYVDRQLENDLEDRARELALQGVNTSKLKVDWEKFKESQQARAIREVKASLILARIAERESLYATQEEVDRELNRISRQLREPVAAVRMKMQKDGSLNRVASRISTEKVLNFLFEKARKVAPA
jgi:trigger factor